jgi:L-ascorbate metabolism protein UlaG (beta-lactamase superfamily)
VSGFQVRFLGQSCFHLSKNDSSIIIDPFNKKAGHIDGELVYCTHGHSDHTGGVSSFMERNSDAILLTNGEVAMQFKQFSDRCVIANDGGSFRHGEWEFLFIKSKHGLFNNLNLGVIVRNGVDSFGHPGDTISLEGFSSAEINILAVPITGIVTLSPISAISELKTFDQPLPTIVVMHWVTRNPDKFCQKLSKEIPKARCIVPIKGELVPF